MTDQPVHPECLHVTRPRVAEPGRQLAASREALESTAAERSSPRPEPVLRR